MRSGRAPGWGALLVSRNLPASEGHVQAHGDGAVAADGAGGGAEVGRIVGAGAGIRNVAPGCAVGLSVLELGIEHYRLAGSARERHLVQIGQCRRLIGGVVGGYNLAVPEINPVLAAIVASTKGIDGRRRAAVVLPDLRRVLGDI